MRRPCVADAARRGRSAPKCVEHLLGVVAGRLLLDHGGRAGRGEAGQQHRRLELRRRHRRLVFDRDRIARALQRHRQPAALARSRSVRAPIRSSGSRMRRIGRLRRLASPSKVAVIGQPATAPIDQAAAGAGIAEIERRRAARQSRRRRRRGRARRRSPVRSTVAPSARMALAVLMTSSPSSRPVIRVSPTASAPRIRERCEIDLSPGTRTRPGQRPASGGRSAARRRRHGPSVGVVPCAMLWRLLAWRAVLARAGTAPAARRY